jgi:hypothetical protein
LVFTLPVAVLVADAEPEAAPPTPPAPVEL